MNQSLLAKRPSARRARGLILCTCLLVMSGCYESPMSFSPSGGQLAFVTCEPFPDGDLHRAGPHAFRLMVLDDGGLRVLETTTAHLLTGPGYSADGKRLAYLRIPLLETEQALRLRETIAARGRQIEEWTKGTAEDWAFEGRQEGATTRPAGAPALRTAVASVPPTGESAGVILRLLIAPPIEARLIVRRTKDFQVVSDTPVRLPMAGPTAKDTPVNYVWVYCRLRPRFSPDGKRIAFWAPGAVWSVDPVASVQQLVAAPALTAAISPDGKTIALLAGEGVIGLCRPAEGTALYKKLATGEFTLVGWLDEKTFMIATAGKGTNGERTTVLMHVRTDGAVARRHTCPQSYSLMEAAQFAVSPDGRRMVICKGKSAHFMTIDGQDAKDWRGEEVFLQQPVFSPDSKRVAFKCITESRRGAPRRTASIVIFSAAGEELARTTIPPIPKGTTRPAPELPDP